MVWKENSGRSGKCNGNFFISVNQINDKLYHYYSFFSPFQTGVPSCPTNLVNANFLFSTFLYDMHSGFSSAPAAASLLNKQSNVNVCVCVSACVWL